jgi:DNA (cytosine-5)-methyltransferase 1
MGYSRAGFEVVGVDIKPQPNYPFEFIKGDALELLGCWINNDHPSGPFDVVHASPPCQRWLGVPRSKGEEYPDLIAPTRKLLRAMGLPMGLPYVIENVPDAPLQDGFILCGATFGLPVIRHRRFEVSPPIGLAPSLCPQGAWSRGVDHGPGFYPFAHGAWRPAWREHVLPKVWPWMTLEESHDAIPPAYTEFIGTQIMSHLKAKAT